MPLLDWLKKLNRKVWLKVSHLILEENGLAMLQYADGTIFLIQDDMESARTIVNAIHTATGKNVSFTGICMVRVQDGKIAEAWNNYDFLNMYQQLGQNLTPLEV